MIPYRFITVTPEHKDVNHETRQAIRSHVMQRHRREQRMQQAQEEDDATYESASPLSRSPSAGQNSNPTSPTQMRHQLPTEARNSTGRTEASYRLNSSTDQYPQGNASYPTDGTHRRSSSVISESIASPSASSRRVSRDSATPRTTPHLSNSLHTFHVEPRRKHDAPKPPVRESGGLESQELVQSMSRLCESYLEWLVGNESYGLNSVVNGDRHQSGPTRQVLLLSLTLKSVGILGSLKPGRSILDEDELKAQVLALINKRLRDSTTALSDETIEALACLTSYEVSRGSTEPLLHLKGISQIIKLRGGLRKMGSLARHLEILDLLNSVYSKSFAVYTQPAKSNGNSPTESVGGRDGYQVSDLDQEDLEMLSGFFNNISDASNISASSNSSCRFFNNISDASSISASSNNAGRPGESMISRTARDDARQWYQHLALAVRQLTPGESTLARIFELSARLHVATTSAIKGNAADIQGHSADLFRLVSHLPEEQWSCGPTLRLRVLLTALSSAQHRMQKSWYHAHALRCLLNVEGKAWADAKALLLRFIDMQAGARNSCGRVVRAMVNDVEVVMDLSEAVEDGLQIRNGPLLA